MKRATNVLTGPVVDLVRRAELVQLAAVHHRDLVGHAHGLDLVVGDVDHRLLQLALDALQLAAHILAESGVQIAERLVEQEDAGLRDHAAAERDLLHVVDAQAPGVHRQHRRELQQLGDLAAPRA